MQIKNPLDVLTDTSTTSEIKQAISYIAIKYGLDYEKFVYTVEHESSFDPHAISPGGSSVGPSQYTLPTWLQYCSDKDDRTDIAKSLNCMGYMWSIGLQYHWDAYCFHYYDEKCIKLRGLYPK